MTLFQSIVRPVITVPLGPRYTARVQASDRYDMLQSSKAIAVIKNFFMIHECFTAVFRTRVVPNAKG